MDDGILESSYPTAFAFQGQGVRVLTRKGQPWFVAMDVCKCLGLQPKYARQRLDESELGYVARTDLGLPAGKRMCLFSESGLYTVILRSDKPQARPFQQWVTREVLPAIRKDGMYVMGEEKLRMGELSEDELVLKAMTLLRGKTERLTKELTAATTQRDHYKGIVLDIRKRLETV
ncbi:BRO-N domain-containing protein [Humidesulfovibrio idahonensis]